LLSPFYKYLFTESKYVFPQRPSAGGKWLE
jgi:hypothetical protein